MEDFIPITPEGLDQILKDYEKLEDLLSENGLLQQLIKALVELALNGKLMHRFGFEKPEPHRQQLRQFAERSDRESS